METILQVRDLHTSFLTSNGEVQAVRGVSFDVEKGKTLGIVGESGSGKSVTSLSILKLLGTTGRINSGSIKLDGEELTSKNKKEMRTIRGGRIAVIKVPCLRLEAARAVISASGDEQGNADAGAVGDIRFLQSATVQR